MPVRNARNAVQKSSTQADAKSVAPSADGPSADDRRIVVFHNILILLVFSHFYLKVAIFFVLQGR